MNDKQKPLSPQASSAVSFGSPRRDAEKRSNSTLSGFPSWPVFDEDEIAAVCEVLRSGKVNRWTGEQNELFEEEFAGFCDCRYAVAVANGTVALELALQALGIGPGDEVIVGSRTFIASASAVVMRGAKPIFADIDLTSQNITPATVKPLLTDRTRAIIAVHLAGWPCDMDALEALARPRGIKIVEDCAQALGARYKGRPVGSLGDVAAFSFCQDKIMTTGGEGGMLISNSEEIWRRAWSFKDHGKNPQARHPGQSRTSFRWLHDSFGTNWRMTEMQAAIGRVGLRKVPEWLEVRRRNAARLNAGFENFPGLRVTIPSSEYHHAYYKYYCFWEPEENEPMVSREKILADINAAGIPCYTGSCSEIYREEAFSQAGLRPTQPRSNAQKLGQTSMMFLVHPGISLEITDKICETVEQVIRQNLHGIR